MRKRQYSLLAIACLTASVISSCSTDARLSGDAQGVTQTGTLNMPLTAFGQSGAQYMLVNAQFEIKSIRTARTEATLFSDDDPFASTLSAELDAGNYTVELRPGWSIERLDSGGFGGADDFGGDFVDDFVDDIIFEDFADEELEPGNTEVDFGDTDDASDEPPITMPPPRASGVATAVATTSTPISTGSPIPLPPPEFGQFGERVKAALSSDAIQFVPIFSNEDSFVIFSFDVGDDVVTFDPGRVHIGIEINETEPPPPPFDVCDSPDLAQRPAVIETNTDALRFMSLRVALDAVASNGGFQTSGEDIYHQIIDSYATADEGRLTDSPHCGDETTNGQPTLNGFPILCNREERNQFDNLDLWFPMAFVNRMDLAPLNGAHCGQQRMVFGNGTNGRMFFIVEAQIPNPNPEAGIAACAPVAQFWAGLNQLDADARGVELTNAFVSGHPDLQAAGFGPFYSAANFSVGSGQIRTNNFNTGIWTLREFKLVQGEGELQAIPFPVAEAPHGNLWNDDIDLPQGPACRDAFISQALPGLLSDNLAQHSFVVPHECKDAESQNLGDQDYATALSNGSGAFAAQLAEALEGTNLTPNDLANRARFSGSCIGCHIESSGAFLGSNSNGEDLFAPFQGDFVHISESTTACVDGNGECHQLSEAVETLFLPHRLAVMRNLVTIELPPQCDTGGADGGVVPVPGFDGGVVAPPSLDAGGPVQAPGTPAPDEPLPMPSEPEVASIDTPADELVEQDQTAREAFGDRTLGGQSAQQTH